MKREWNVFRSTVMFLTRIPVGRDLPHDMELLQDSPRYFPLVGMLVGLFNAVVFIVASQWFSQATAILLAMAGSLLLTGAFHEDGFADTCDAFGGGWTKEKIMTIMKDSRLGTYGVAGLGMMLAGKWLLLQQLLPDFEKLPQWWGYVNGQHAAGRWQLFGAPVLLLLAAHGISRLAAVTVIQQFEYATDPEQSKVKPLASKKLSVPALLFAGVTALLPMLGLPWFYMLALVPVAIARTWLALYFKKWIGGYTGDCLGATQQVCEVVFYASIIVLSKYAAFFYGLS